MAISQEQIESMRSLTTELPQPLPTLARLLNVNRKSIWDFLGTKKGSTLFSTKKVDGFIWVRVRQTAFNLIKEFAKFKQTERKHKKEGYCYRYGKVGVERRVAIGQVMKTMDIRNVESTVYDQYTDYLERINSATITLIPDPDKFFSGDLVYLPYKTRFNDEGRKVESLKKYERIFDESAAKFKDAVFLTLTIDPKMQHNLWTCNKEMPKAFNKLMSFLTRRHGGRFPYINVYEFQKNGRLHMHIVFFNTRWLLDGEEMSRLWDKYGQGSVVKFLSLKSNKKEWQWSKNAPSDCKGDEKPDKYLKKYLKKNLYNEQGSMQYWVYGTRFFTNSRMFEIKKTKLPPLGWYKFLGISYDGFRPVLPAIIFTGPGPYFGPPKPKREISQDLQIINNLCQLA